MPTFQELTESRRLLREFCQLHHKSISTFWFNTTFVNYLTNGTATTSKRVHLTSSATCFASLSECPGDLDPPIPPMTFADSTIVDTEDWKSDGAAHIYCRCRALPFVIRHITEWNDNLAILIKEIFAQMEKDPGRLGIGETGNLLDEGKWYPPNGYHTFWALEVLEALHGRFQDRLEALKTHLQTPTPILEARMRQWARESLGYQVSLHSAHSSTLDSDQLAWSIAILLRSTDEVQSSLSRQDLTRQALKCLFETQTEVGSWRRYAPLFHYPETGNAHSYMFETFSEILRCALQPRAEFARSSLKQHFEGLMRLWKYARSTQAPLENSLKPKAFGWSSGHRTGKSDPESWATASVFSYAQYLRRLVGIWAREEALAGLPTRRLYSTPKEADDDLTKQTQTWSETQLKQYLLSKFVDHIKTPGSRDLIDPDHKPISKDSSRSAILFGPPGTGKTTIARALAGIVGWDFVELHASHFVAEGLPFVQRTADEIFRKLMELDHAVVLFDEIDELVREREGEEADAFGRFLTTSMLPKIAELWKSCKVMYFVATNHISYFDRAITRYGRFDELIFVSPPSFSTKVTELISLLKSSGKTVEFTVSKKDIEKAMPHPKSKKHGNDLAEKDLAKKNVLAKFALLRWDELKEVAGHLESDKEVVDSVDKAALFRALEKIQRTQRDFFEYDRDRKYERRATAKNPTSAPKVT